MTAAAVRNASVESWEDHVEAWHHLGREVDGAAWGRAAIAASLKGRYGEDAVGKFSGEVGFSPAAVYRFALTFEAFPEKSHRCETLTFSHHMHAAVLTENTDDARAAVALAEREGWSANALRAHLRRPAELPPPATEACSTSGACGPLTTSDRIFHVSAAVDAFYAVKDYDVAALVKVGTKKSLIARAFFQRLATDTGRFDEVMRLQQERVARRRVRRRGA